MKVGIIIGSNELSRLNFASMYSIIAASNGDDVFVFITMEAVKAFVKGKREVKVEEASSRVIKEKEGEDAYINNFKKAKKAGNVKIYACSYASQLFGLKKEDYEDIIDEIAGIMTFDNDVYENSRIISVW